jgi:hypothetical protein
MLIYLYPWGKWVGNHPQVDLVKFGYRLKRAIEMFWIPLMFML